MYIFPPDSGRLVKNRDSACACNPYQRLAEKRYNKQLRLEQKVTEDRSELHYRKHRLPFVLRFRINGMSRKHRVQPGKKRPRDRKGIAACFTW